MPKTDFLYRNLTALLLVVVLFSSCNVKENIATEKVDTKNFSIEVPIDMAKTDDINELAILQYQNVRDDIYFLIIEEEKSGFQNAVEQGLSEMTPNLKGYFQVLTTHFGQITDNFNVSDVKNIRVHSSPAIVFSMTGKSIEFKKSVFYRYAVIEDDRNYYQIMAWTNPASKQKLIDKMEIVISSFKSKSISKTNNSKWQKKNQN